VHAEQYDFIGPPYAVFIYADGKIMAIHGSAMSPNMFVASETQLVETS
jgi:hypothetical protein